MPEDFFEDWYLDFFLSGEEGEDVWTGGQDFQLEWDDSDLSFGDDSATIGDLGINVEDPMEYVRNFLLDKDIDEDSWFEEYGMYLNEYDYTEENLAGKQLLLEQEAFMSEMIANKETLDHNINTSGFISDSTAERGMDYLNNTTILQNKMMLLDHQKKIYDFRKSWESDLYDMLTKLAAVDAFE